MKDRHFADLGNEHIPVTLFAQMLDWKVNDEYWVRYAKVWCAFYDWYEQSFFVNLGKLSPCANFDQINCMTVGRLIRVEKGEDDPFQELIRRIDDQRRSGMMEIAGDWYIDPVTNRLVDTDRSPSKIAENLIIRAVGVNGFDDNGYISRPGGDRFSDGSPISADRLTERLARSNPIADTWFFQD